MHTQEFNGIEVQYHFFPAPIANYGEEQQSPRVVIVSSEVDGMNAEVWLQRLENFDDERYEEIANTVDGLEARILEFEMGRGY